MARNPCSNCGGSGVRPLPRRKWWEFWKVIDCVICGGDGFTDLWINYPITVELDCKGDIEIKAKYGFALPIEVTPEQLNLAGVVLNRPTLVERLAAAQAAQ